ncbi:MAG: FHA domain-containing protein [Planctomycetota bacterium]
MRAILEITSEMQFGHKRAIRAGQVLEVGRSSIVDFCIESDESMSGRHFRIRTDERGCYLEDLQSANGTSINGAPVTAPVVLRNLDRIVAGGTRFQVHLSGNDPSIEVAPTAASSQSSVMASSPREAEQHRLENELFETRAEAASVEVDAVIKGLMTLDDGWSLCTIVDRAKKDVASALGDAEGERLYQWLSEEDTPSFAPRLYRLEPSNGDSATLGKLLNAGWGKDALVMVFWESEDEFPLSQLSRCAGAFTRPSLLASNLNACPTKAASDLMIGIRAVLIETAEGECWSLFSMHDDRESLKKLNIEVKSSTEDQDPSKGEV